MPHLDTYLERRLYARRIIEEETGCWLWTGYKNKLGYGEMGFMGRKERVHRVAAWLWLDYEFEQPEMWIMRQHVLHTCNTPACFNPEHLYLGDNVANSRDAREAGTTAKHSQRKLTDEQVNQIRDLLDLGIPHRKIVEAVDFETNTQTVSMIRRGLYYADVERGALS